MKNIVISFSFLLVVICSGCQKENYNSTVQTADLPPNFEQPANSQLIIVHDVIDQSFLEDFPISVENPAVSPNTTMTIAEVRLLSTVNRHNQKELEREYPRVKAILVDLQKDNVSEKNSAVIQAFTLWYLRSYFLAKDLAQGDQEEVRFLLDLALEVKAVDIDVLADAFVFCRSNMRKRDQQQVLTYLTDLIERKKKDLWEIGRPAIEEYKSTDDTDPKKIYHFAHAKHYEKQARSIHYALELIPELASLD
jgi:hypothetical protein